MLGCVALWRPLQSRDFISLFGKGDAAPFAAGGQTMVPSTTVLFQGSFSCRVAAPRSMKYALPGRGAVKKLQRPLYERQVRSENGRYTSEFQFSVRR